MLLFFQFVKSYFASFSSSIDHQDLASDHNHDSVDSDGTNNPRSVVIVLITIDRQPGQDARCSTAVAASYSLVGHQLIFTLLLFMIVSAFIVP